MRHLRALLCSFLILAATGSLNSQELKTILGPGEATGNAPAAPGPVNPLQVALLKWYRAGQDAHFPVGSQPYGMCFDGANIWVANYQGLSVSKIRASDGATLGTFALGIAAIGVAFDGADIWVTNNAGNTLLKLRAETRRALSMSSLRLKTVTDKINSATKFSVPTVANGNVYLGTQSSNTGSFVGTGTFYIFGLSRTC